jgi:obg-like ATPase 1
VSVSFEDRLTRFSDEEAAEECKKLETQSALPKIVTTMRKALHLGSFFTTGTDEVRQWTIREGTKAPQAAGVIHGGEYFRHMHCFWTALILSQTSRRPSSSA